MLESETYKIEQTGGKHDDHMFKHMILTEEQYEEILKSGTELIKIAEESQVDFISVRKNNKITFKHISAVENESSINKSGLSFHDDEFIYDLGKGIYVIEESDEQALDNLKTYVAEGFEDDEILLVTGWYTGEYTKCVYGFQHEGYIVLSKNVDDGDICCLYPESLDEFLLS